MSTAAENLHSKPIDKYKPNGYRVLTGAFPIPASKGRKATAHDVYQCDDCQFSSIVEQDMITHRLSDPSVCFKFAWPEGFDHDHQNDGTFVPAE